MASSPVLARNTIEVPTEPRADKEGREAANRAVQARETTIYVPRSDRLGTPISGENAQGRLSPEATVFVANLPQWVGDDQLRNELEAKLAAFGPCFAKVRRDRQQMPMAFVSFPEADDAGKALEGAGTLSIEGRSLRVEPAKADRAVLMTRRRGGRISNEEACEVLGRFGPIEETSPISIGDQTLAGLPDGRWVKFAFYEDCHEAETTLRRHSVYRLLNHHATSIRPASAPQETRGRQLFRRTNPTTTGQRSAPRPFVPFYEPRGIFIGNLPTDISEEELSNVFSQFGAVESISVRHKHAQGSSGSSAYCFIIFEHDGSVENAMHTTPLIRDTIFQIDRKRYRTPIPGQERRFNKNLRSFGRQSDTAGGRLDPQGRHQTSYQPHEYHRHRRSQVSSSARHVIGENGFPTSDNTQITNAESQQPTDPQTPDQRPLIISTEDGRILSANTSRLRVRTSVRKGTTFFHHDDDEPDSADHAHPDTPTRHPVRPEPAHSTEPAYSMPPQPSYSNAPAYSLPPPIYYTQAPYHQGYSSYPAPNVLPFYPGPGSNNQHYYNGGFGYTNPLSFPPYGHHGQPYHY